MNSSTVVQFYRTVIDDVINNVRETFLEDGIDEQVLLELKQVWESKITQSKAIPNENEASGRENEGSSSSAVDSALKNIVRNNAAAVTAAVSTTAAATVGVSSSTAVTTPTVQYHYTTAPGQGGDETQKTVTITLPSQATAAGQKPVTITLPAHLMQNPPAGGIIMSASAAAAAQALPAGIAAGLLQSQLTRVITQQQPDGTTVSYQAVTAEQLAKQGYVVSMAPRPAQPAAPAVVPPASTSTSSSSSSTGQVQSGGVIQLDGANDTSDDDDDDDDLRDDDNDPDDDDDKLDENEGVVEEEVDSDPLNSEDDVSDEDPSELFDTDNVIVCQYDKITRSRNKWKFHLKDGIMNVQGKDYIFQKAIGDAEW